MKFLSFLAFTCFVTTSVLASDVKIGGITFKDKAELQSEELARLGAGVRKKFFLKITSGNVEKQLNKIKKLKIFRKRPNTSN